MTQMSRDRWWSLVDIRGQGALEIGGIKELIGKAQDIEEKGPLRLELRQTQMETWFSLPRLDLVRVPARTSMPLPVGLARSWKRKPASKNFSIK